jgi:HEAT repeat protein
MQNLQHTNWRAAAVSARALGDTNFAPDLVVPALTECLHHPRREVRIEAPLALMEFGAQARSALPALSNAVVDRSFDVRKNAIIAIQQIASEALTNTPAR